MPIQLSWYLENRVILLSNHGEIKDQDLFDIDEPIIDYMNQCDAPLVHLIVDNRDGFNQPSAKSVTQVKFPKHPKMGWLIMVGVDNPIQKFVVAVGASFFKTRVRIFKTMDEAANFLNEVDSTLPALRDNNKAS